MKKINFILTLSLLTSCLFAQKKDIFTEYFNNNDNSWYVGESDKWSFKVENGVYKISRMVADTRGTCWGKYIYINQSKDFSIKATIMHRSGIENFGYGIVWGYKDADNTSSFLIAADGHYKVMKTVSGTTTDLIAWTKSSAINQGNNVYNVLRIEKTGSNYLFYINGTYLTEVSYEYFSDQNIGFEVYDNQSIEVDDLIVSEDQSGSALKPLSNNQDNNKSQNFAEYFSDNSNNWYVGESDKWSYKVENGLYKINRKLTDGKSTFIAKSIPIDETKDFTIESDIEHTGGVKNYGYGVTWGYKDTKNCFIFYISGTGYYKITKIEDDVTTNLVDWTFNSSIVQTDYTFNKMKIEKSGNNYSFYVNGTYLTQIPYEAFFGQQIGFELEDNQSISVDDLIVNNQAGTGNQNQVSGLVIPDDMQLIFNEDFSDNSRNWFTADNEHYAATVYEGKYILDKKDSVGSLYTFMPVMIDQNKDFIIQATLDETDAIDLINDFGLMWGMQDVDNTFEFDIEDFGSYMVREYSEGTEKVMIDWADASSISTYYGANTLTIYKKGEKLNYYINGDFVNSTDFKPFPGNKIGFILFTEVTIDVDDIKIWQPK